MSDLWTVLEGDARARMADLPASSVDCVVTSPPYWGLRDYGVAGQLGLEETLAEYLAAQVEVFRCVRRVLKPSGTLWVNMGDAHLHSPSGPATGVTLAGGRNNLAASRGPRANGYRPRAPFPEKSLLGLPWRIAFALQDDGWILRRDHVWNKLNPMPESVRDRCTASHEFVFLFSKSIRPTCWRHRDGRWAFARPAPDVVWQNRDTKAERTTKPRKDAKAWRTKNLWRGFDYFYDADAIKEPCTYNGGLGGHHRNVTAPIPSAVPGRPPHTSLHQSRDRVPRGWDTGSGNHRDLVGRYPLDRPGGRRDLAGPFRHLAGPGSRFHTDRTPGKPKHGAQTAAPRVTALRNKRDVWTFATQGYAGDHFATFPEALVEPCVLAGCPEGGVVLDPYGGVGTAGKVALRLGRRAILIELNPKHAETSRRRLSEVTPPLPFGIDPGAAAILEACAPGPGALLSRTEIRKTLRPGDALEVQIRAAP